MKATFDIGGFVVVLPHVRNVYPVTKGDVGWEWGFKFTDGFFETFHYATKTEAAEGRAAFRKALEEYWIGRRT